MSKHTPGPWEFATPVMAGNDRIIIESYPLGSVACVSLNGAPRRQSKLDASSPDYQEQIPTMEANAALIAAAPDLLEALRDTLREFVPSADRMTIEQVTVFNAAKAAIAKAQPTNEKE